MATVDKNFKVKHGLIVEGTTATVNGNDILTKANDTDDITEGNSNLYFTEQRAVDAVADEIANAVTTAVNALTTDAIEEGEDNLYFTTTRARDAVSIGDSTLNYDASQGLFTANTEVLATVSYVNGQGFLVENDIQGKQDTLYAGSTIDSNQLASNTIQVYYGNTLTVDSNGLQVNTQEIATRQYAGEAAYSAFSDGTAYTDNAITTAVAGLASETYVNSQGFITANDITNKQDVLTAGAGVEISGNTISAGVDGTTIITTGGIIGDKLRVRFGSGLAENSEGLVVDTDVIATKTYTDNAITAAVDGLVDGAPGLLDTLNELAAAINDDENYATTMTTALAGKQATLIAGAAISSSDLANNIVSVVYGNTLTRTGNSLGVRYGTGLSANSEGLVVDTMAIAEKSYVDTNFVNVADLPGQLDDYVLLSEKGSFDGVATLDGTGNVPVEQLGNVPDAFITALGNTETNLSVTQYDELVLTTTPTFVAVDFDSVAKQVAAKVDSISSTPVTLYSFKIGPYEDAYSHAEYTIASYATKMGVPSSTYEREITKVLLTTDNAGNVAITEYGTVTMNDHVLDVTAEIVTVGTPGMGGYYQCNLVASSAISGVTVDHATVVGTLFK